MYYKNNLRIIYKILLYFLRERERERERENIKKICLLVLS